MRGFLRLGLTLALTAALLSSPFSARAEGTWYLRVIGRDNTPAAQAEKLRVRDAILAVCPAHAADLAHALPALEAAAEEITACQVTLQRWSPDEKTPAAPTVYITLGAGSGKNWWGLLYEDSLLLARAEDAPEAIGSCQVEFLWPWLAWIRDFFCGA